MKRPRLEMNRRQFIASTVAGAAGIALSGRLLGAATAEPDPFAIVPLGKTGLKASRIGLGTGVHGGQRQSNHTRMGKQKFDAIVKGAWDRGIRFFDAADTYGTHPFLADALKGLPRDQYLLTSKIWFRDGGLPEKERPDADVAIDRFRRELKTDYIDLVQMHCMTDKDWTDRQKRQMDIMENLKSKGVIRAHGVSIHSLPALRLCATTPWVDSVHTRINPFGVAMDGKPEDVAPVIQSIHAAGKGVVGMKLIGEGRFKEPEQRTKSIEYVLGLGAVDVMIVGFEDVAQIDDFSQRVKLALAKQAATV